MIIIIYLIKVRQLYFIQLEKFTKFIDKNQVYWWLRPSRIHALARMQPTHQRMLFIGWQFRLTKKRKIEWFSRLKPERWCWNSTPPDKSEIERCCQLTYASMAKRLLNIIVQFDKPVERVVSGLKKRKKQLKKTRCFST